MANLHTALLFAEHNVSSTVVSPPAGELWVVRTITVFYQAEQVTTAMQIVGQANDVTYWYDSASTELTGEFKAWYDLRLVWDSGVGWEITGLGGPDVSLHGFKLTTP